MASRAGGGIGLTIFHKVMSANCRETCHFISADDQSVACQAKPVWVDREYTNRNALDTLSI